MAAQHDVIVVGGGLIGLFSAHALLRAGHRVTILERGSVGGGAARGNGGWICPSRSDPLPSPGVLAEGLHGLFSPSSPFHLAPRALAAYAGYLPRFARHSTPRSYARGLAALDTLNRRTHSLYDQLRADGVAVAFHDGGWLTVHDDAHAASTSHQSSQAQSAAGRCAPPGGLLDRDELLSLEPGLGPAARHGFLLIGDRWVDPSALVDALASWLDAAGATILTNAPALAIDETGPQVRVTSPVGRYAAARVVIANGAWSRGLLRPLGIDTAVVPGKGYSFEVRPSRPLRHIIVMGGTHVAATPIGDRLRIVGTVEMDGTRDVLHRQRLDLMRAGAKPYLTGIDWDAASREWVGPRPMTPDGLPLIGVVSGHDRVIVATGHNMLGLSLGPATGELVAHLVAGDAGAVHPAFAVNRFTGPRGWLR